MAACPKAAERREDGLVALDRARGAVRFLGGVLARVDDGRLAEMAFLIVEELDLAAGELDRERREGLVMMLERDRLARELAEAGAGLP